MEKSQTIIVEENEQRLQTVRWLAENKIIVSDWSQPANYWYLDPNTSELIPVNP
jgi:hypothetical protein